MKIIRNIRNFVLLSVLAGLSGCQQEYHPPLPTVPSVDLRRFMGDWYEIALLPNQFQSMCVADTKARYRQDGDRVRVKNSCRKSDGTMADVSGIAKVVEGSRNAKLRVSFFRPFYGDYWVLALDPEYRWVLVGEPSRKYGWVLSRQPVLEDALLQNILDTAVSLGYERSTFLPSPHSHQR